MQSLASRGYPESQCGFRTGRSTIDMVFSIRQLQEKYREQQMPFYIAFVDLTKALVVAVGYSKSWKKLAVPHTYSPSSGSSMKICRAQCTSMEPHQRHSQSAVGSSKAVYSHQHCLQYSSLCCFDMPSRIAAGPSHRGGQEGAYARGRHF